MSEMQWFLNDIGIRACPETCRFIRTGIAGVSGGWHGRYCASLRSLSPVATPLRWGPTGHAAAVLRGAETDRRCRD